MLITFYRRNTIRSLSSWSKESQSKLHRINFLSKRRLSNNSSTLSIWDSFGKQLTSLTSQRSGVLSWYACGPTVYDSAHIGHASSYIRQDVIRRILERIDGKLCLVQIMGVTDIDDKIIKKANQLQVPWESISRKYELEFFEDLANLNVKHPHIRTRVSDFIPQIIHFVKKLVDAKLAYPVSNGSVYFDTEVYGKYGKLRKISDSTEVEEGQDKKNSKDFAVWKGWKLGEPFWKTPWGKGRPGWHIECSVMASHYFGSKLDIHSGGTDLIFPHHENEEAQCCAHFGIESWVTHWIHTGHLNIKNEVKMSKSLGNTITIQDFLQEHPSQLLRMFCILSKYQTSLEFSPASINHARSILKKFESFISDADAVLRGSKIVTQSQDTTLWESLISTKNSVHAFLRSDFDTASAVQIISEYIDSFNRNFTTTSQSKKVNAAAVLDYGLVISSSAFVKDFLSLVGITENETEMSNESKNSRLDAVLTEFVQFRTLVRNHSLAFDETDKTLRKEKLLDRKELMEACDEVRDRLNTLGIDLKDHGKQTTASFSFVGKKIEKTH